MNAIAAPDTGLQRLVHNGVKIIELRFTNKPFGESSLLLQRYAGALRRLGPDARARVLVDFSGACLEPRLAIFWKASLGLFKERVEKSAVIGAVPLLRVSIQGFAMTARFLDLDLGPKRAVTFSDREVALDWLAR